MRTGKRGIGKVLTAGADGGPAEHVELCIQEYEGWHAAQRYSPHSARHHAYALRRIARRVLSGESTLDAVLAVHESYGAVSLRHAWLSFRTFLASRQRLASLPPQLRAPTPSVNTPLGDLLNAEDRPEAQRYCIGRAVRLLATAGGLPRTLRTLRYAYLAAPIGDADLAAPRVRGAFLRLARWSAGHRAPVPTTHVLASEPSGRSPMHLDLVLELAARDPRPGDLDHWPEGEGADATGPTRDEIQAARLASEVRSSTVATSQASSRAILRWIDTVAADRDIPPLKPEVVAYFGGAEAMEIALRPLFESREVAWRHHPSTTDVVLAHLTPEERDGPAQPQREWKLYVNNRGAKPWEPGQGSEDGDDPFDPPEVPS